MLNDADQYFQQGKDHVQAGQLVLALQAFDEAIRLNPEKVDYYLARASVYQRLKQRARAIDDLTSAIHLQPKNADYFLQRGILYEIQQNFRLALMDFGRVIELDPQLVQAYVRRGSSRAQYGYLPGAIEDFKKALQFDPNNFEVQEQLERVLVAMKNNPGGAPVSRASLSHSSNRPQNRYDDDWVSRRATKFVIGLIITITAVVCRGIFVDDEPEYRYDPDLFNSAATFNSYNTYPDTRVPSLSNSSQISGTATALAKFENTEIPRPTRTLAPTRTPHPSATPVPQTVAETFAERCGINIDLNWTLAMQQCNEAIALDPELADAYYYRSLLHRMENNREAWYADLQKAYELDPTLRQNPPR